MIIILQKYFLSDFETPFRKAYSVERAVVMIASKIPNFIRKENNILPEWRIPSKGISKKYELLFLQSNKKTIKAQIKITREEIQEMMILFFLEAFFALISNRTGINKREL